MAKIKEEDLIGVVEGEEARKYAVKHGLYSLMSTFLSNRSLEETEKIYKACNEKGITWEKYFGIDPEVAKKVIL